MRETEMGKREGGKQREKEGKEKKKWRERETGSTGPQSQLPRSLRREDQVQRKHA